MCTYRHLRSIRKAFTLVELLVVIGVIAVLIALLMPALSGARDAANRAKCLSNLRSILQAAHMHAQEHRGYMPIAGSQVPTHLGVTATPEGLVDRERKKYMYFDDASGMPFRPVPLPAALGYYMGLGHLLRGTIAERQLMERAMASDAMRRPFACPGQGPDAMDPGYVIGDGGGDIRIPVYMSYVFNGSALARQIHTWGETPAGRLSGIRRPTEVFLFADGNSDKPSFGGYGSYSVHATANGGSNATLFDGFLGRRNMIDFQRHRGRINVMFVDGHGETLMLPNPRQPISAQLGNRGDLDRVGLTRGIFN
jgi:prepilin-type N-terminal cleavage/methylation domain-containing protein/prepilin-type processing-associated H-X9-DG protein